MVGRGTGCIECRRVWEDVGKPSAECSFWLIIECLRRARSANRRLIARTIFTTSFPEVFEKISPGTPCVFVRTKPWKKDGFAVILFLLLFFSYLNRDEESVLISVILVSRVVVNDPVVAQWWYRRCSGEFCWCARVVPTRERNTEGKREGERERRTSLVHAWLSIHYHGSPPAIRRRAHPRWEEAHVHCCRWKCRVSLSDPFILITIIICRANLRGAATGLNRSVRKQWQVIIFGKQDS